MKFSATLAALVAFAAAAPPPPPGNHGTERFQLKLDNGKYLAAPVKTSMQGYVYMLKKQSGEPRATWFETLDGNKVALHNNVTDATAKLPALRLESNWSGDYSMVTAANDWISQGWAFDTQGHLAYYGDSSRFVACDSTDYLYYFQGGYPERASGCKRVKVSKKLTAKH